MISTLSYTDDMSCHGLNGNIVWGNCGVYLFYFWFGFVLESTVSVALIFSLEQSFIVDSRTLCLRINVTSNYLNWILLLKSEEDVDWSFNIRFRLLLNIHFNCAAYRNRDICLSWMWRLRLRFELFSKEDMSSDDDELNNIMHQTHWMYPPGDVTLIPWKNSQSLDVHTTCIFCLARMNR